MEVVSSPKTLRGRTVGIAVLVPVQFVIGAIHVFFGFWLLTANNSFSFISSEEVPLIYPAYTLAFGFLVLIFTYGVWLGRKWGWTGTVLVSMFVTAADVLTLLNLPCSRHSQVRCWHRNTLQRCSSALPVSISRESPVHIEELDGLELSRKTKFSSRVCPPVNSRSCGQPL